MTTASPVAYFAIYVSVGGLIYITQLLFETVHILTSLCRCVKNMSKKILTLAFLRAAQDDDFVNRLTAFASTHGFCHVELVFDSHLDSTKIGTPSFSIFAGGTACIRSKAFSNPNYEFLSLSVSALQYDTCYSFCNDVSKSSMKFDSKGMWLAQFHPGCMHTDSIRIGSTFCSKIITEALQIAHIDGVDHLVSSAVTPSRLYGALCCQANRTTSCIRMRGGYPQLQVPVNIHM